MPDKKEPKPFNQCLLLILIGLMILTGSVNTIFNKILQKLKGCDILFEQHHWIITFGMFCGEFVSIFLYLSIVIKRKKQIQLKENTTKLASDNEEDAVETEKKEEQEDKKDEKKKTSNTE